MRIQHALVSVSDKSGLEELAAALSAAGTKIYSTGGTAAALASYGCSVEDIGDLTGYDEMLGGRVKTLHPNVHAAILADTQDPSHLSELREHGLPKLDLVVVNFYPFEKVLTTAAGPQEIIENIDIGGPTMARAAAKNYTATIVLTDPADYPVFIARLKQGEFDVSIRRNLAAKAFVKVAHLDALIANHFSSDEDNSFPEHQFLHLKKVTDLKYGENPHQPAACYRLADNSGGFTQLQGAALSYNNMKDAHSAWMIANSYDKPAAVIVKHNNPCGIAVAQSPAKAFSRALQTDSVAAFGGIVALNRPLDEETALLLQESFWDVIIAPQFSETAKSTLAFKERLKLLIAPPEQPDKPQRRLTSCGNLLLLQATDTVTEEISAAQIVTKRQPDAKQLADMQFAWRAAAGVISNAVVLAHHQATIGIGAGQMSRADSVHLACEKAGRAKLKTAGSVAASDGFFPFPDGIEILAANGVTAVIQPGGSKNDDAVIAAADAADMAMIMTGTRHFRH